MTNANPESTDKLEKKSWHSLSMYIQRTKRRAPHPLLLRDAKRRGSISNVRCPFTYFFPRAASRSLFASLYLRKMLTIRPRSTSNAQRDPSARTRETTPTLKQQASFRKNFDVAFHQRQMGQAPRPPLVSLLTMRKCRTPHANLRLSFASLPIPCVFDLATILALLRARHLLVLLHRQPRDVVSPQQCFVVLPS
jgi:hypothetical protein